MYEEMMEESEAHKQELKLAAAVALSKVAQVYGVDEVSDVVTKVMMEFFPNMVQVECEECQGNKFTANDDGSGMRACGGCDGRGWT